MASSNGIELTPPSNGINASVFEASQTGTDVSAAVTKKKKKENFAKRLYRQNLRGYVPIPTPAFAMAFFLSFGTLLLALGIAVLVTALNVNEETIRYDNIGVTNNGANISTLSTDQLNTAMLSTNGNGFQYTVSLTTSVSLSAPVYIYYQLGNYYQNYRRYINSVSWKQIHGVNQTSSQLSACDPLLYVYYDPSTNQRIANSSFPQDGMISPCGLWSWSYFNDTYSIRAGGQDIPVDASNLAWSWQRDQLFGDVPSINFNGDTRTNNGTLYNVTAGGGVLAGNLSQDQRFMVWMRPEAHYSFSKLWGVINQDIQAGTNLEIDITSRYNTYGWGGLKAVMLSENSWMGGRNLFLGSLMIAVGGVYYLCALVFAIGRCVHHRPMGDERYLSWNRNIEKKSLAQNLKQFVRR